MLLAKHAQHVALIHFPIALFIVAVRFDVLAHRLRRQELAEAAYHNLLVAAIFAVPAVLSGRAAWQWLLEGHRLKGILLYHPIVALASATVILLSWWMRYRARRNGDSRAGAWRISLELAGVLLIVTSHLGGFVSGVNGVG